MTELLKWSNITTSCVRLGSNKVIITTPILYLTCRYFWLYAHISSMHARIMNRRVWTIFTTNTIIVWTVNAESLIDLYHNPLWYSNGAYSSFLLQGRCVCVLEVKVFRGTTRLVIKRKYSGHLGMRFFFAERIIACLILIYCCRWNRGNYS